MTNKNGYYIKARCIMQSEVMRQPPHVREVWDWLLMNANHSDGKSSGVVIKRGQLFTTLDEIRGGLAWYIGYRKECYTKDHMKKAMKALKKASMITTNKSTRGMLITVCNYTAYQSPKYYESTNESTNESTTKAPSKHQGSTTINKKKKNDKNKEIRTLDSVESPPLEIEFNEFWFRYPTCERTKGSKHKALAKYKVARKTSAMNPIMQGLANYAKHIEKTQEKNADAFRWINDKRWEDEYEKVLTEEEDFQRLRNIQDKINQENLPCKQLN